MNATQKELALATIDVFFDSVQLVVSLTRFAFAIGLLTRDAGFATIQAGRDARIRFDAWVDEIVENATFRPTALLAPAADDDLSQAPTPPTPDPVVEAEIVPATPKTDELRQWIKDSRQNYAELANIAADLIEDKEESINQDLADLGIRELRQIAKGKGIEKYSRKSKAELIQELATV